MQKIISCKLQAGIQYNGCWEQRKGRIICRWIVFWKNIEGCYAGCIGGYSGGGSFQLEKFYIKDKITIFSYESNFSLLPATILDVCESCQDYCLTPHDEEFWMDSDNLILKSKIKFKENQDIHVEGDDIKNSIISLFDAVGLISKPT